jgi:3',5'-cyclic AMP phosphodiesterase CpdA
MIRTRSPRCCKWRAIAGTLAFVLLLWAGLSGACGAPAKPKQLPSPTVEPPAEAKPEPGAHVFCVFGDTQPDHDPTHLSFTSRLASAMADEHPDVVLGCGDYVDGAPTYEAARLQFDSFLKAFKPLQKHGPVPFAAAVGNHDVSGGRGSLFTRIFGKRYYSFDLAQAHFIILDAEHPGQEETITGKQWEWLCQDLWAAQNTPLIFVVVHEPLFPVSVHRGSALDRFPKYRDRLHMLLAQSKVSAVFSGHEHLYNHQKRDGVNYFITGGGGGDLYASAANGGFHHYLKVTFTDKEFAVTVQRLSR